MMYSTTIAVLAAFVSVASAHFQLQYPLPRGPFVQNSEPTFCDGYNSAVPNRTTFPLSNGVINMNSEHPQWTVGVLVSTSQDPTSFNDFNAANGSNQLVVNFFQTTGEGLACFNIDLLKSGISGVKDGANVTLEVVFDGGDGTLYQCADLTLSSTITLPSNATSGCKNVTSQESNTTATSGSPTASSTSPASSTTSPASSSTSKKSGASGSVKIPSVVAAVLALGGVALAL